MIKICPLKTETDYDAALREIERLFDAAPNTPEGDRLEVLTTLVEAYEAQHEPIPEPDPIEALKYYMESRGLTIYDLEPLLGNQHNILDVLERKRPLSLPMIRRLHDGLGMSADILIQPYKLLKSAA